jgi:hypothetical protein
VFIDRVQVKSIASELDRQCEPRGREHARWWYRMPVTLEALLADAPLNNVVSALIAASGRAR